MTDLKSKLESYLSKRQGGKASISSMIPLSGGACQENYLIDLSLEGGTESGEFRLVFRTDKGASLFASLSRANEFKTEKLAYENGVKTPRPYWLEEDSGILGSPFYFMERIGGKATGRFVVKDSSLSKARKNLASELALSLSRIHSITPDLYRDESLKGSLYRHNPTSSDSVSRDAVLEIRRQISAGVDPQVGMELIANWLEENIHPVDKEVLVHGDFRTGNFMVSPEGLEGILDWEFAHWGDRHEDIAWLCMRDWRFGKLNKEAGGIAERQEFYDLYSRASGFEVDPFRVRYWEIMGNLRWALGSLQQAERHLSGKDKGIELAAIGRRTKEMVWEAMRLIENAG